MKVSIRLRFLALVTVCLSLASLVLARVIYPLKYALFAAHQDGSGMPALMRVAIHELGIVGILWIAVAAAAGIALIVLELRRGAISAALNESPDWMVACLLLPIGLWLGHAYLEPGVVSVGDANTHAARVAHLLSAYADGGYPGWSNYFYAGTPVLIFTGPLFHWLGAAAAVVLQDVDQACKAVLIAAHLVSIVAMFGFLRGLGIARFAASIGAIIYTGAFLHLHQCFLRGAYPQALIFALLPLLAWAVWCVVTAARVPWIVVIGLTLALAAALTTHQVSAVYGGLQIAVLTIIAAPHAVLRPVRIAVLALTVAFALLIAGAQIVPIFTERDWLVMGKVPTKFGFDLPDASTLSHYTTWRGGALTGPNSAAYLSYSGILLAAAAIVGIFVGGSRGNRRLTLAALATTVLTLCVSLSYVRQGVFVLFALGLMSALGAQWLVGRPGATRSWHTVVLLIVLADMTGSSIYPLARTDKDFAATAAVELAHKFPMQRIATMTSTESTTTMNFGPNGGIEVRYPLQKLDGPHNITVPKSHNYLMAMLFRAERELATAGRMSAGTQRLFSVTNVGALAQIERANLATFMRLTDSQADPVVGAFVALPRPTPAVFAPALRAVPTTDEADTGTFWRETFERPLPSSAVLAAEAALDAVATTLLESEDADQSPALPVREPVIAQFPAPPAPTLTHGRVTRYRVERTTISLEVETDGNGFVRLAHPYYPALQVTSNGQPVMVQPDPLGMMVLPIGAGTTTLEITATRTPIRFWCGAIAFGALSVVIALGVALALRQRRRVAG